MPYTRNVYISAYLYDFAKHLNGTMKALDKFRSWFKRLSSSEETNVHGHVSKPEYQVLDKTVPVSSEITSTTSNSADSAHPNEHRTAPASAAAPASQPSNPQQYTNQNSTQATKQHTSNTQSHSTASSGPTQPQQQKVRKCRGDVRSAPAVEWWELDGFRLLQAHSKPMVLDTREFFAEYASPTEANRYQIREIIGKGSYGVVCSAVDNFTGEKVAIKKITNVFEHVSDATRILREIKLLRLLKHPGNTCSFSCIPLSDYLQHT